MIRCVLSRMVLEIFRPTSALIRLECSNQSHVGANRIFNSQRNFFQIYFLNRFPFLKTYHTSAMAKSKFEYVRLFETEDRCLPNTCW